MDRLPPSSPNLVAIRPKKDLDTEKELLELYDLSPLRQNLA